MEGVKQRLSRTTRLYIKPLAQFGRLEHVVNDDLEGKVPNHVPLDSDLNSSYFSTLLLQPITSVFAGGDGLSLRLT